MVLLLYNLLCSSLWFAPVATYGCWLWDSCDATKVSLLQFCKVNQCWDSQKKQKKTDPSSKTYQKVLNWHFTNANFDIYFQNVKLWNYIFNGNTTISLPVEEFLNIGSLVFTVTVFISLRQMKNLAAPEISKGNILVFTVPAANFTIIKNLGVSTACTASFRPMSHRFRALWLGQSS